MNTTIIYALLTIVAVILGIIGSIIVVRRKIKKAIEKANEETSILDGYKNGKEVITNEPRIDGETIRTREPRIEEGIANVEIEQRARESRNVSHIPISTSNESKRKRDGSKKRINLD